MEPELTPTSVGELLRRAREARGVSVARAESDMRIRRGYLEALESDNLESLPPPVFTRGLVRTYASYLGVDVVEALELLSKEEARSESIGVVPAVPPDRVPKRTSPLLQALGLGVAILATAAALYVALPSYQNLFGVQAAGAQVPTPPPSVVPASEPSVSSPVPTAEATTVPAPTSTPLPTVQPTSTPVPEPTLAPEARQTATAAAAVRGVRLEVRSMDRVWAQVDIDGVVAYSGTLMPGERRQWRGERRASLHVGNAGLVEVTFNGQSLGTLGPRGEVVKKEWLAAR